MIHRTQKLITGLTLVIGITAIFISGCGIKTHPVPPRAETPKPVNDLSIKITDSTLTLKWTIPKLNKKEQYKGFTVYRAATPLTSPECTDCPKLFEKAGVIQITDFQNKGETITAHFQEILNKGYKYSYMVKGLTEKGVQGPDSKIVTFDY